MMLKDVYLVQEVPFWVPADDLSQEVVENPKSRQTLTPTGTSSITKIVQIVYTIACE